MRPVQKVLLLVVVIVYVVGGEYSAEDNYNRRPNHHDVTRKMVEYWSRPDVLKYLPRGVKEYVEIYIQKHPHYSYQPPASPASPAAPDDISIHIYHHWAPEPAKKEKGCVILK